MGVVLVSFVLCCCPSAPRNFHIQKGKKQKRRGMKTDYQIGTCNRCGHAPCICDTTTDYYQVLPLQPQPEGVTTVTQSSKRTPQKHRQYWAVMKAVIGQGGMIRSKRGLLRLMDEIEEWVG